MATVLLLGVCYKVLVLSGTYADAGYVFFSEPMFFYTSDGHPSIEEFYY